MTAAIPSPSANGLHVGPLFVHAYGLAYVVAVLAAVVITSRRWVRRRRAVLCLIGLAWFARSQRAPGRVKKVNGPALLAAGAIGLLSGCGHTAQSDETHLRGSPISQLRIAEPAVMSPGGQAPISKPPGVVEFPHVPV